MLEAGGARVPTVYSAAVYSPKTHPFSEDLLPENGSGRAVKDVVKYVVVFTQEGVLAAFEHLEIFYYRGLILTDS